KLRVASQEPGEEPEARSEERHEPAYRTAGATIIIGERRVECKCGGDPRRRETSLRRPGPPAPRREPGCRQDQVQREVVADESMLAEQQGQGVDDELPWIVPQKAGHVVGIEWAAGPGGVFGNSVHRLDDAAEGVVDDVMGHEPGKQAG